MAVTEHTTLRQIQGALDASSVHILNTEGEEICMPIYNRRKHMTEFMCTKAYTGRLNEILDARVIRIADTNGDGKPGIFFTLDV